MLPSSRVRSVCGIAGKVSATGPVDVGTVESMCQAQAHRGPDSKGIHASDGACLGIQRLRVIDLETGDQPIYNESGSVAVVLNGEIYNYRELRTGLEKRGHEFATHGDTEVIAHLYEECGPDLVEQLEGMFCFAIWDVDRRRLTIGRDRIGKKPLFYWAHPSGLSFASELFALTADPEVPRDMDPTSVEEYLTLGYIPAPRSIWRGVAKLPPAHLLVWEDGSLSLRRYWQLDYDDKRREHGDVLQQELREMVASATRRRMIADVPVGLMLSGGIDSAVVLAEMAAVSSQPVRTFSIGFDEEAYNELPRARRVARVFGAEHHEQIVTADAISLLPRLARHYGEPFADSSAIPSFYLAEMVSENVTVALNGDGGDESFGGYLRYVANTLGAGIDRLPDRARTAVASAAKAIPGADDRRGPLAYGRRFLESVDRAGVDRYLEHVSVFSARDRQRLLRDDFLARTDRTRPERYLRSLWYTAPCDRTLDRLLAVDVASYLPNDLLVKMDIASMASSLEARSPLLDREVMEFAASLPPAAKVSRGRKKWLLRQAYTDVLPDEVLNGRKRGFAVPLERWFREDLLTSTRELLSDPAAKVHEYMADGAIEELIDDHVNGRAERSAKLWALVMLETWHHEIGGTKSP